MNAKQRRKMAREVIDLMRKMTKDEFEKSLVECIDEARRANNRAEVLRRENSELLIRVFALEDELAALKYREKMFGGRTVTGRISIDIGPGLDKVKHQDVPIHLLDYEQPTTCPMCGVRTEFEELAAGDQFHHCKNCGYRFIGEFDTDSEGGEA